MVPIISQQSRQLQTIWMYWDRGLEQAPELVHICVDSWRRYNPDWSVRVLDESTLPAYVDMTEIRTRNPHLTIQAYSDALRWRLLRDHGGVWADATLYCCRPLNDWLANEVSPEGFFAFRTIEPHLYYSWFLVGGANSSIVQAMGKELDRFLLKFGGFRNYWELRAIWRVYHFLEKYIGDYNHELWRSYIFRRFLKAAPYFFVMYLMGAATKRSSQAQADFEQLKMTFADAPHALQLLTLPGQPPDRDQVRTLLSYPCPVQKLTTKRYVDEWKCGGIFDLLDQHGRA